MLLVVGSLFAISGTRAGEVKPDSGPAPPGSPDQASK